MPLSTERNNDNAVHALPFQCSPYVSRHKPAYQNGLYEVGYPHVDIASHKTVHPSNSPLHVGGNCSEQPQHDSPTP